MKRPVVNVADAPMHRGQHGEQFEFQMAMLGDAAGADAIGANVTRVPPGKAAFPLHHHHANEEHCFILSGSGVLRVGAETFDVKPQDYIVHRPGGAETMSLTPEARFLVPDREKNSVGYWDGEEGERVREIVVRSTAGD